MASKFTELAKSIAGTVQNFDQQADELARKHEDLRRRGERVFARHRESLAAQETGIAALEQVVNDLEGSNSGEGSGDSSEQSKGG